MALYGLSVQFISWSKGHTAVAAAAYRSGEKIKDEIMKKIHDYTNRDEILHKEIIAPDNAPEWATDRKRLWNNAQVAEINKGGSIRKKARFAKEVRVSLPRELNLEQNTRS